MQDTQIVALYWARSEDAVAATEARYGRYLRAIARNILHSEQDSEECVNDAYLRAWEAIPPRRPRQLGAFLGRIARNLALDRWRRQTAAKRGLGQAPLALEELAECVPDPAGQAAGDEALADALDRFLAGLSREARIVFLQRYWYLRPVREIAADRGATESKVKMSLLRTRGRLRDFLEQEGIAL